ncbi:MAG TPA: DUF4249 family protein [Rubricoccaceae bacterium]|jgi:hypothetical protein
MPRFLALAALALAVSACDTAAPESTGPQVVVAGFLEASERLADVRITRTVPLGSVYDSTAVLRDARVEVQLLSASGGVVEEAVPYALDAETGAYVPTLTRAALAGRTYRLVAVALGDTVTAETTVPAEITLVAPPPDEVFYQADPRGPQLRITTSSVAGRQSVYIASTAAQAPDEFEPVVVDGEERFRSRNVPGRFRPVPFVALFADCDEVGDRLVCDEDPNDLYTSGSSPIINESSYVLPGDGTAIVNVPWLAFGFYGPSTISLVALDDAFQDFVETQTLQQNPTTISPGEVPNVTTNVRGGLGVFGSFARITTQTTIRER